MEDLVCREAGPADVHDLLAVRNPIFPPLTVEQWARDRTMTCCIARLRREPVGAIPLSIRNFQLAPGTVVSAAFENAVGTREDRRSKGIGTAMIRAAREFLADRCDELMVYRGGERTIGYRFYINSGHRDMVYLRMMVLRTPATGLAGPRPCEADVRHGSLEDAFTEQPDLLRCFEASYGHCGGFPVRHADYWQEALGSQIYVVLPQEVHYFAHPAAGELQAYVLASLFLPGAYDKIRVLELASATGEEALRQALLGLLDYAARRNLRVEVPTGVDHPYVPLLRSLGFEEGPRYMMLMAQPIDPTALGAKVCRDPEALSELRISYWAPFGEGLLFEGRQARRSVTIEAKDEVIYRLLNLRLDVRSAYEHDLLNIINGTRDIAERIGAAFPYTPWVYHGIDYI